MRAVYRRLFRIQVRHNWYPDGVTRGDFEVVPTRSTAALLDDLGLRTHTYADGVIVFGEVDPATIVPGPPTLRRSLGAMALRFAFELRAANTGLLNISELPPFRPSQTIFCFDNLREDIAAARTFLGDAIAAARIAAPIPLVAAPTYQYTLGAPAAVATITIKDRFGIVAAAIEARSPDASTPIAAYAIDLAALGVTPGRYAVTDEFGGSTLIYYDPGVAASRPFGIIEIFSRTEALTPDSTNRVPATYRFMNGDAVTALDPYFLQFEAVATTWRYVVTKKYTNNAIAPGDLTIAGPITFTGAATTTTALFTSTAAVRLSAAPRGLTLQKGNPAKDVQALPDPGLSTPLSVAPPAAGFVSNMFVYV